MSMIQEQAPQTYTPAYNDIIFVVSSTNVAQANFQYVCDLKLVDDNGSITFAGGATSLRLKCPVDPTYSSGVFNIGKVIETYVSHDIGDAIYGSQKCPNSVVRVEAEFGEEYGPSSGVTVYAAIINTDTSHTTWNANFDFVDFKNYSKDNYVVTISTTGRKFLTSRVSSGTIQTSDNAWLYSMSAQNAALGAYVLETWNSAGAFIARYQLNNNYGTVTTSGTRMIRIPAGLNQFNQIPTADYQSGAKPVDVNVARYSIHWETGTGITNVDRQWYTIDTACTQHTRYRLHFLNKLGGFDSFTFKLASEFSTNINRRDSCYMNMAYNNSSLCNEVITPQMKQDCQRNAQRR